MGAQNDVQISSFSLFSIVVVDTKDTYTEIKVVMANSVEDWYQNQYQIILSSLADRNGMDEANRDGSTVLAESLRNGPSTGGK